MEKQDSSKDLEGLLVVTIEQAVAAPYTSCRLADAGARVIKVERPEGDFARDYDNGVNGKSSIFAWLNRGKQSICLDLKTENDLNILKSIISQSDVLLSNLAPQSLNKLGLPNDVLNKLNPHLINCKITGYGETKEAISKKAYDFLVQAESGLCSVTGTDEYPSKTGISISDLSTGLTAYSAILRALIKKYKTGEGTNISISMFDVMADWMNMPLLAHRYMGGAPKRTGLKHSFISPYGVYNCGDHGKVLLSIQSNREFQNFCINILKKPNLFKNEKFTDNPSRNKNKDELDELINKEFSKYNVSEVLALLNEFNIANSRLNSVEDLSDHPFLNNGEAIIEENIVTIANLPVLSDGIQNKEVPALGEHTISIRNEFK